MLQPRALVARLAPRVAFALALLSLFPASASAQRPREDSEKEGMEKFEEVDPYTQGDRDLEGKLGYTRVGHGPWHAGEDTHALQENMGGVDMIFVETEHFRIASSLTTYEIPNNREEREKIDAEFKRLKKKLGRFKPPKKKLDPWLRLHLYAQRAEDQYAEFCEEFSLVPADFAKSTPYLGYPNKILLLVCQRKSEFGRYVRAYHATEQQYSYRTILRGDTFVVAANIESLMEGWETEEEVPYDSMLHNQVVSVLIATMVDAYRENMFSAPRWFAYGLAHLHLRRVNPEWTAFDGRKSGQGTQEDWKWSPRVLKLVKNDFYATADKMFTWQEYGDLNTRDHMVAWSKVEFLMTALKGNHKGFLDDICGARGGFATKAEDTQAVDRQRQALQKNFDLTPEEFDEKWAKWVKKTYKKRKD